MAVVDAAPASARCRDHVSGREESGKIRFFTEGKARRNWSERVRRRYSAEYDNWNLARRKTMVCRKGAPGRTWYCRAAATPCNRT